ncbi:MAG: helix-turn-helix domain-containing protein [Muribaculaceae bacterium]|nr:helix-turn-helix domain-containing protein [Muribaculaceae bacterium]
MTSEGSDKEINNHDKENDKENQNDRINTTIGGIYRPHDGINDGIKVDSDSINDGINQLNGTLQDVYNKIVSQPEIIATELMKILKIFESTVTRSIRELKRLGFIKREGSRKNGKWIILK